MNTSVVIVSHRAHRWLRSSLESVVDQADEVVLVDNGSPHAEVSEVGRRYGVRLVRSPSNLGFPAGVNLGIGSVRGDVVGLLNDDAMAGAGWLSAATRVLADDSVAAVAPKTVFALRHAEIRFDDEPYTVPGDQRTLGRRIDRATLDGRDVLHSLIGPGIYAVEGGRRGRSSWRWTSACGSVFAPLPEGAEPASLLINDEPAPMVGTATVINNAGSYLSSEGHGGDCGFGEADNGLFDQPMDRFAASGVAMVIRREVFDRLGGFTPGFFAYYEDVDWCWRAQLAGLRIRYEPGTVVRHIGGVTSGGPGTDFVRFLAARNRILTLAHNAPFTVLGRQLAKRRTGRTDLLLGRSLARRLPGALVRRAGWARIWARSAAEVWQEWAGVEAEAARGLVSIHAPTPMPFRPAMGSPSE